MAAAGAGWGGLIEMTRMLSILGQAVRSLLTSRDIALELLIERAMDRSDQRLLRLMTKRVAVALRLQRDKKVVHSEQGPGQYMVWQIAR